MKKILIVLTLSLFSLSAFSMERIQRTFYCSVNSNAQPYDTFTIHIPYYGPATVSFVRLSYMNAPETAYQMAVPGCHPAASYKLESDELEVKCAGDAGEIELKLNGYGQAHGEIEFEDGNIGYRADTELSVNCFYN